MKPLNFTLYFCSNKKDTSQKICNADNISMEMIFWPISRKYLKISFKKMDRLLNMGSTQDNNSFNSIVASKQPKNRFIGGSESTAFRLAAAVSQKKTIGHDAISKVR